ncbi:MAG: hypothetical protein ABGY41_10955, partial [Candidatus Poribacteria bacterium]
RSAMDGWEQGALARVLERFPERRTSFSTSSATTNRVYTPLDVPDLDYLRDMHGGWTRRRHRLSQRTPERHYPGS